MPGALVITVVELSKGLCKGRMEAISRQLNSRDESRESMNSTYTVAIPITAMLPYSEAACGMAMTLTMSANLMVSRVLP